MNMTTENAMRATAPSTIRPLTPGVWHVDPDHSEVTFRVKAMRGLITVSGRFKALDGTIHVRESMALRGRLRAHAISLDTGIRMRDGHLRSADFFDAQRHPYIEFSVQKLADGGASRVRVAGDLVIRGMAYPLEVEAMVRDLGDGTVETAAQAMVERAAIGRSLKRGRVITGPAHLAARIRFVRDGDTWTKTDDRRDEQVVSVGGAGEQIRDAVLTWEGVESHPHRFGGIEYRLHAREIGHVHGDRLADLPFPKRIRDELVAAGLAEPHHILPQSGWVSFYIRQPADIERAISLLRRSYELAVAQQRKRKAP